MNSFDKMQWTTGSEWNLRMCPNFSVMVMNLWWKSGRWVHYRLSNLFCGRRRAKDNINCPTFKRHEATLKQNNRTGFTTYIAAILNMPLFCIKNQFWMLISSDCYKVLLVTLAEKSYSTKETVFQKFNKNLFFLLCKNPLKIAERMVTVIFCTFGVPIPFCSFWITFHWQNVFYSWHHIGGKWMWKMRCFVWELAHWEVLMNSVMKKFLLILSECAVNVSRII